MFISDEWLISYAGFQKLREMTEEGEGRGLFNSIRGGFMIAVINNAIYKISSGLSVQFLGPIDTQSGEVSIDENLAQQICIVDGRDAYIYHYELDSPAFSIKKQELKQADTSTKIVPNFVEYHNSFFLIASAPASPNPQKWYAFERDNNEEIKLNSEFTLQTKPDRAIAIQRLPGKSNHVLVIGEAVSEVWAQVGDLQNYQRVSSYNIDYGCAAVSTIASSDTMVCWLARNENNSPVIMMSNGGDTQRLSTDGIDHLLGSVKYPEFSTAFFYRQNGHLFYQLTFTHEDDNFSLIYDTNTNMFFHITDEDQNYHPARQVVYFNGATYFVSLNDASLYQMGEEFDTYNYNIDASEVGETIPRIRVCKSIRKEDSSIFRVGAFTFWLEQGVNNFTFGTVCNGQLITEILEEDIITEEGELMLSQDGYCTTNNNIPRVDMTISKDGNRSFSNVVSRELNARGNYRNQINWHRLGQANEFTIQLRFWGMNRFVAGNGTAEVY